ncbi:hypothetical protein [Desulforamulus ruminis]|uniref:Uncharacterized protein n=1 Tax=Desulforamulus ruminis (strain ATCC 23193 / DSM 2154 / NCIMB 8452 / DL) TaxID=696281 RepID=F6DTG9_DESRL|nr:hypothetical protein [Desulforamulus ruminis]AEG60031.1 hypothetical protein Desru_1767 [Desulforamulus ruminis DSM 2154]
MKEQLITAVSPQLLELSVAVFTFLCAVVGHKGATHLKQQTAKVKNEELRQVIWDAIDRVDEAAEKVIGKIEQTTAGPLREAVKAGSVDREELLRLGRKAYWEVRETVGSEVVNVLERNMGDFENYLTSTIENKVLRLKAGG